MEKTQKMLNKDLEELRNKHLEELKNKQTEVNILNEVKNSLEGINSRIIEAEEWISDLEDKIVEITILSSRSLIHSSASIILLLIPSREFLTSLFFLYSALQ